jgi:selenocysteine lyase/cysteine desulfurase
MLTCQKDFFTLSDEVTYLNNSYYSPFTKGVEQAGLDSFELKRQPYKLEPHLFFEHPAALRAEFSKLVGANDPDRIAIMPSVSYGMATVANNVKLEKNENVIIADEQFPSNFYVWERLTREAEATLIRIAPPEALENRGATWNTQILEAISENTKVVTLGNVHWADGTLFDLKAIRKRTREVGALLIIDGTQSVGALPFNIQEIQPDALICAGYKWLLGPYGLTLGYFSSYFDHGKPIEDNWQNRLDSHKFENLVNYQPEYREKAQRFNMGQQSTFFLSSMSQEALRQLNEWGPNNIQEYCNALTTPAVAELREMGCWIENENNRAKHLFGIRLPEHASLEKMQEALAENNIKISVRGSAVRLATHLYNDENDMQKLVDCFKEAIN